MRSVHFPILVYHSIDDFGTSISLTRSAFERQVRWLREHGWNALGLSEAARRIRAGEALPPRSMALTFDDAMPSVLEIAAPILREHGYSGSTFVVTGQVGRRPEWYRLPAPYRERPLLDRQGLDRLRDDGWEILPHTHEHPVLPHLSSAAQLEQIARSREAIHEWFGSAGDVLAYPYGQHNEDTRKAMQQAEMSAGVTLEFSSRVSIADCFAWPRVGSAWLRTDRRMGLAMRGWFERYVRLKTLIRGGRARHFQEATAETTRGLEAAGRNGSGAVETAAGVQ
ncbi:MAG: polysaccharide deacetylase family protein [Phycisphaerales bacterium]